MNKNVLQNKNECIKTLKVRFYNNDVLYNIYVRRNRFNLPNLRLNTYMLRNILIDIVKRYIISIKA